jgi:hypothetical protein
LTTEFVLVIQYSEYNYRRNNSFHTLCKPTSSPQPSLQEAYNARFNTSTGLGNISIPPRIIVLSLQKLLLNQTIDILLDARYFQRTPSPCRFDGLSHQFRMTDSLPRLQDSNNGGLRLVVAVGSDALVRFLVLRRCFFELHCVDFDAVFGVGERCVQSERVCGVDFSGFGVLG